VKLRDYQRKASDSVFSEWENGARSTLVVMPTGTGKTLLFSDVIQRKQPKRSMVLAHREELIWQAKDKIERVTGLKSDVEMGEHKAAQECGLFHPKASVIVSTIQTHVAGGDGGGRMTKFDPMDFGLLVIDESHHAVSPSYRKVIDYYMTNPDLVVMGVTATPDRGDESALGQVFETVAFDYEVMDAIKDGWLIPIEQQMVSVESLDFSEVKTTAGDLNGADLAAVMESEKNLHGVASSTIDIIGSKRGIGFAASVNHARVLSEIFNRHKTGMSAWVCGKTDKEERKKIISDFAAGKIQWLWNCGVFTEGFDDSGVEIISMARPTKSRALYAQMAGRATRPHESIASKLNDVPAPVLRRMMIQRSVKPSCCIIDFVGNSGRHKLMTTADILGGNVSDEVMESAVREAIKAGRPVRMDKQIEEEEKKFEERRIQAEARKARLVAKSSYKTQRVDPFDILSIKPNQPRGWDEGKQLSEKMRGFLKKAGFDPDVLEYSKAKQMVGIIIDRWTNNKCSIKQAAVLKKYGYDTEMSFDQAKQTIDGIAAGGWKKKTI
jgi:superfamily II DNA or RNA helicase